MVCAEKIAMPSGSDLQANLVQRVQAVQTVQVVCGQGTMMQHHIAPPQKFFQDTQYGFTALYSSNRIIRVGY